MGANAVLKRVKFNSAASLLQKPLGKYVQKWLINPINRSKTEPNSNTRQIQLIWKFKPKKNW